MTIYKNRSNFKINFRLRERHICEVQKCIPLKDFAKKENISVSTVRYRLATGKLIGYKIGGDWVIKVC